MSETALADSAPPKEPRDLARSEGSENFRCAKCAGNLGGVHAFAQCDCGFDSELDDAVQISDASPQIVWNHPDFACAKCAGNLGGVHAFAQCDCGFDSELEDAVQNSDACFSPRRECSTASDRPLQDGGCDGPATFAQNGTPGIRTVEITTPKPRKLLKRRRDPSSPEKGVRRWPEFTAWQQSVAPPAKVSAEWARQLDDRQVRDYCKVYSENISVLLASRESPPRDVGAETSGEDLEPEESEPESPRGRDVETRFVCDCGRSLSPSRAGQCDCWRN
jgi:hypothetical protein